MILGTDYDTPETTELAVFWMQCAADRGHAEARAILEQYPSAQKQPERLRDL